MKKLDFILLIDDNDADNEFHEIVINQAEITSRLKNITSSRQALEYLQHSLAVKGSNEYPVPDLVFLDINMPAMNGFELLDRFRELPDPHGSRSKIKIFMLTGSLNPDDYKKAMEEYGDLITGFRIKPLTDTIFLDIVQSNF